MRLLSKVTLCCAAAVTTACSTPLASNSTEPSGYAPGFSTPVSQEFGSGAIQHIVVIVQENRTVDNLFNGFPGADTVNQGRNRQGQTIQLHPTSLTAPFDMSHTHKAWLADYDGGNMDGFSSEGENCYKPGSCPPHQIASYGYVPRSQVEPYWDMALQYTFADEMFQSNQGPSFPAHQYIISGTSTIRDGSRYRAVDNAVGDAPHQGGCSSRHKTTVDTIDDEGKPGPSVFPCFDRKSIVHEMDNRNVTWRYFQEFGSSGQWHAVDALSNVWHTPSYASVKYPSKEVLHLINRKTLPQVTFITPSAANSDHAGRNDGGGPSWVTAIVNSIGRSSSWRNTAIIVVWDDWGGWYDHVKPQIYNSYELGFRVPMIVISPYAKQGYVSHVHYEFGSILKLIEQTFGLRSLGTTDRRAADLGDCFDFAQPQRRFVPIRAPYSAEYFERQPVDNRPIDDD